MRAAPRRKTEPWALGLLFAVAALLRIALALRPGLWADELFSLAIATGHSLEHPARDADPALGDYVEPPGPVPAAAYGRYLRHETPPAPTWRIVRAVLLSDTSPPLYYVLLGWWTRVAGTSDAALRLLSVGCAVAALPFLWAVGREVGGRDVAWTACVLFAFCPRAAFYAAEGRMYALLWLLAVVLAWSTLRLARGGGVAMLALWSVVGAAGLLTHYFFAFVWGACVAWAALHAGRLGIRASGDRRFAAGSHAWRGLLGRRALTAAIVLTGALVLPWYRQLPASLGRWRVTGTWLDTPLTAAQALGAPVVLAGSLLSGRGEWGGSLCTIVVQAVLCLGFAAAILARGLRPLVAPRWQLVWLWLAATVVGPVAFDVLRHTSASLVARYALPGLPAAVLVVALGLGRLSARARVAFVVATLLLWTEGLGLMFAASSRPREPFPTLAAALDASVPPVDLAVVHSIPSGVLGMARYLDPATPIASWVAQLGLRRVPEDIDAWAAGRSGIALVKIHGVGVPSPAETWLRAHADVVREERFNDLPNDPAEIIWFAPRARADRPASPRPATSAAASSARETPAPPAPRSER